MEGSSEGLDITAETQELEVLQLVTVEVTAHVDTFTSHYNDFVAVQDEFGDDGGQTTHQMATAIDHNRLKIKFQTCKEEFKTLLTTSTEV